ncbi:hypothetical protein DXG01_011307 [Tephrocybe rancida]|nr:hypothetical protein DXG01_011307 [Tephrocybe rancida]
MWFLFLDFDEGEALQGVTPFTGTTPVMGQTYNDNENNRSQSDMSPYPGYITHGGTAADKLGVLRSWPSVLTSHATSSTTGLLSAEHDTSGASTTSGSASISKATDFGGAAVVRASAQPLVSPSDIHPQSFAVVPLYDDTPPAYHQSPPAPLGPL